MIQATAVNKTFEDLQAVQNLTLHVKKGSIYGLLGSNGAGKTTLLKMMAGIYKQDNGSITIAEKPVFETPDTKQHVLFIPDQPHFLHQSSLKDMGSFYKEVYTRWNQKRFEQLTKHFRMNPDKKLTRMSKGMQRQAAFILTLSTMPDVLILDEPFDGLDPVVRQQMKNVILQDVADRKMTLIVSSHNLREMEDFCDYVGIMHNGGLLFERDLDELKTDIHKLQVAFKVLPDKEEFLKGMDVLHYEKRGSVLLIIVKGNEDQILPYVKSFNPAIFDLLPLTLEEIFIYELGGVGYEIRNLIVE
ncbi:ABC transporter ATP-binding protein [Jeotgalibacillus sp. R-1-5s-1]|uniref:ABC transporter ATP-binding protein n=1 Tax=Jeotgalibacillus sp. R-1-5s-1 TaxID=2555897 RepID=UPI001069799C|nr:ABC transporter ATP-binding protein [Jeotgalibacillus sp. R-1-5s-1]TFD96269.1 ABC transporter ATP-binding protein [Jeotgalibacillus sp. R-1-5s-1]